MSRACRGRVLHRVRPEVCQPRAGCRVPGRHRASLQSRAGPPAGLRPRELPTGTDPASAQRDTRQRAGGRGHGSHGSLLELVSSRKGKSKSASVLWPQSVTHLAGLFSLRLLNLLRKDCFLHPLRTDLSLCRRRWPVAGKRCRGPAALGLPRALGHLDPCVSAGLLQPPSLGRRGFRTLIPVCLGSPGGHACGGGGGVGAPGTNRDDVRFH